MKMSAILVIAAHPDDEVLGCGGSLVRHVSQGDAVSVAFMTDGVFLPDQPMAVVEAAVDRRRQEAQAAARILGVADVEFLLTAPTLGVTAGPAAVAAIERAIARVRPRVIYTHRGVDDNGDHRETGAATVIAARFWTGRTPHELEEVRGFPISPVRVTDGLRLLAALRPEELDRKLSALACYVSELERLLASHPRRPHMVRAQMETWGAWIGTAYAEAFELLWRRSL